MMAGLNYQVRDSIGYIELSRPERSNALDLSTLELMDEAVASAAGDDGVKALVFHGAGKGFCSGYDLHPSGQINVKHQSVLQDWARLQRNNERWERIFSFPKPTLAKVHGYAVAGGLELAMACDLVVATTTARFGHPPLRALGTPPFMIFGQTLGHRDMREMLFTGNSVPGSQAQLRGWITRAVSEEQLDAETEKILSALRAMPLENLLLLKRLILRADMVTGGPAVRGMGVEFDAIAHRTQAAGAFWDSVDDLGLREALKRRDAPFREWDYVRPSLSSGPLSPGEGE
ncbi:enoyl-CoA hydratase-related protein [Nonomuraea lactucae]|uniref:enoyl-CoA hydratase-related protein n=1 Tax=Nonomuraea lactucae TaxID=2249762 RepID=UPI000DE24E17|nr:enoyl-CoA hydratase-related protein [Nonomuraea lactucae]